MREKLIGLLKESHVMATYEEVADFMIANGVTIPVRCKDCKNNRQCSIQDAMNWTPRTEIEIDPYCSYGERRTEN